MLPQPHRYVNRTWASLGLRQARAGCGHALVIWADQRGHAAHDESGCGGCGQPAG
ncbi:MAG: hypothetical protein IPP13_17960 [Kouleothrix sp.]|nr:hypothetical protein [Kouleothrix sp.]